MNKKATLNSPYGTFGKTNKLSAIDYLKTLDENMSFELEMYMLWCYINDYNKNKLETLNAWINNKLL